ncbi:hypothetical protein I79_019805 [Cricetulus griseus]|uniref:Uncharacterized protein n=1 Tax=Cricetulus griseus TaxID=10029 RepID=G3IP31_CRIGR|nr:hypothetical protein I79_025733 [Cricetulus griseus]EGW11611.1 hypothetical protein I79_019805 [Cricetulus griseus]
MAILLFEKSPAVQKITYHVDVSFLHPKVSECFEATKKSQRSVTMQPPSPHHNTPKNYTLKTEVK